MRLLTAFEIASGSLRSAREIESATSERMQVVLREWSKHSQQYRIYSNVMDSVETSVIENGVF